jgi:ribosomal-protein-alanine N-acetyltransferase
MQVRSWEQKDITKLSEMERRCFSDPLTEQMLEDTLKLPVYHGLLVEEQGEILGYASMIVVCEDAEVGNIAVDLPFRGRGLSKVLMDAMHERAKSLGATQCFLEVRVSNAVAISLYEKYGYEKYGVRAKYYADGEDAFVMKKSL